MPIRPDCRWLYPIDWPQLSAVIRFRRAKGQCEGCGRPHRRLLFTLRDGRWWDAEQARWRNGKGRALRQNLPSAEEMLRQLRRTRVVLATAHRNHDRTDNRSRNLLALCQRCHLSHDRAEHQRRRWLTLFSRKAIGDLFLGTYR